MPDNDQGSYQEGKLNLDLRVLQAQQTILLEGLRADVKEIKEVLIGTDKREGLILEVDRLKRSRHVTNAVLWTIFTAIIGTVATGIATYIQY